MAKTQSVARPRRAYEYDHHYGLELAGKRGKAGRGSQGATSSRPAKAASTKRSAKKR